MNIDFNTFNCLKIIQDYLDEDVIDEENIPFDTEYLGGVFFEAEILGGDVGFGSYTGLKNIVYVSIINKNGNDILNKFELNNRIGNPIVEEFSNKILDEKNLIVYETSNGFQIRVQFGVFVESITLINLKLMDVNCGTTIIIKNDNDVIIHNDFLSPLFGKWAWSEGETLMRNSKIANQNSGPSKYIITFDKLGDASYFFPNLGINGHIQNYTFKAYKKNEIFNIILTSKGQRDSKDINLKMVSENKFEMISEIEYKKNGKKHKEIYTDIWNRMQ